MFYNKNELIKALRNYKNNQPFEHCIVDNFFDLDVAHAIEKEFPDYENPAWFYYKNQLEDKKALNNWNSFPSLTYQLFRELISEEFIKILSEKIGVPLYQDAGLHGGGWHIHSQGGNLNPHLDYSLHPKIRLQRKINIIIYMSSGLKAEYGGDLGLWSHNKKTNQPDKLIKLIQPRFNRAVIFDTTQNSWHGMAKPLCQPHGVYRKSLAIYYLTDPPPDVDRREKALYAPRENQKEDETILELIQKRADAKSFSSAYRENK